MEIRTKKDLIGKLSAYTNTPDDDSIRYKQIIKDALLKCPELLYALHNKELETELFCEDENGDEVLNIDPNTGELLGEVDRYFGDNSNIRPYLFIPETQVDVKNYLCYQVMFDSMPRYSDVQKYTEITFTIFVEGKDRTDEYTNTARHDLIASILRERFNWSNIFGMQAKLISSKESITDNNFVVRTLVFQITDINGIVNTPYGGSTMLNNYHVRR